MVRVVGGNVLYVILAADNAANKIRFVEGDSFGDDLPRSPGEIRLIQRAWYLIKLR